jgi:predicted amidophosphoribosyltransferase
LCAVRAAHLKELIRRYKFEHARDAYKPIAAAIVTALPSPLADYVVVPVPTVAAHVRERSFDHTLLVAKQVAKLRGLPFARLLERTKNVRQVGASRHVRAEVAQSIVLRKQLTQPLKILLIDDVCTTVATLNACAQVLSDAGATEVSAAVAAWQAPSSDTKKDR